MVFAEKPSTQPRRPREEDYSYSSAGSVVCGSQSNKIKLRGDLEEEFGFKVRQNEGEAAEHGVFFDDTEYDYMQHMRDLGGGTGDVKWVAAKGSDGEKPPKRKGRLEDALRDLDLKEDEQSVGTQTSSATNSLLPEDVLPSAFVKKRTYQDQQAVPDEIAGFQPDMDLRLREVLEALEDEAYVDDCDDENLFGQLTGDGLEVDRDEWERLGEQQAFEYGETLDDGWESDDTVKATRSPKLQPALPSLEDGELQDPPQNPHAQPTADPSDGAWLEEFKKFKSGAKSGQEPNFSPAIPRLTSTLESSALSSLAAGRRKKRPGAKTSTTNYSMTSSALGRTDQQTLLDSRFEKVEQAYTAEELAHDEELNDAGSLASGVSKSSHLSRYSATSGASGISSYSRIADSTAPKLIRSDFDGIMDDFLGSHNKAGKSGRRVRRGAPMSGLAQLDEVRAGLGPARVKTT